MTRVTKLRRGRRPVRRLDLEPMRAALRDRRMWTMLGVVRAPSGGAVHWEVVANKSGAAADIHVEVELQPSGERVSARLPAGMWLVPSIGDEVAVLLPDGDISFMPVIACILSYALPTDQAPTPQRIVVARGPGTEVVIHDGAGGAKELAYKSDVDDLADFVGNTMVIATPAGASTPGTTTPPPAAAGTTVLKAK